MGCHFLLQEIFLTQGLNPGLSRRRQTLYRLSHQGRVHRTVQKNHDPDNHDGVITHLEPDILECEVKWALENITTDKASGGDGIPFELFQILKDDAMKVPHSICQQIWETAVAIGLEKVRFHSNPKERQCSNYRTIALISHVSKVMLRILQARLQQYVNRELPDVQMSFTKGRGTRD